MKYVDDAAAAEIAAKVSEKLDAKQDKIEQATSASVAGSILVVAALGLASSEPTVTGSKLSL